MAQQPKRFAGTVALVTGAGRGIGRQVSAQLVAEGGRVVGVARTRAQLDAVEAELGDAFRGVAADLADPKACAAAADEGLIKLGGGAEYTYVVNCAGIGTTQPFLEVGGPRGRVAFDKHPVRRISASRPRRRPVR